MKSVYTVSQISSYIKNMFDTDFALRSVYVKGEVSNCKYHSTGHIYFTLKDQNSVLSAVMFKGNRSQGLKFQMEEGQTVIVLGRISVYERSGNYQLYASEILLDGAGVLYQQYEQLKKKLEETGYFAQEYKRPIPRYATRVGVVTARTGAAIHDIMNISKRRNPYVQLYLYPATVQGDGAAKTIISGIRCLDDMGVDVIIVGRGGGSIEDLWAFNEEEVAKAIFECGTPVISAVGHETDVTIADYVADLRAPTPSAAAELAVFDYYAFEEEMREKEKELRKHLLHALERNKARLEMYASKLRFLSPSNQIIVKRQYTADLWDALERSLKNKLTDRKHHLAVLCERLSGLSPLNKISGGYAYVQNQEYKPVLSVEQVHKGDHLHLTLKDGIVEAEAVVTENINLNYNEE